jgi:VanZ family protein
MVFMAIPVTHRNEMFGPLCGFILLAGLTCVMVGTFRQFDAVQSFGNGWVWLISLTWLASEILERRVPLSGTLWIPILGLALSVISSFSKRSGPISARLILVAVLVCALVFLSARAGGADKMRSSFSLLGLSAESTWELIVYTRKLIHVTFYGMLAWLIFGTIKDSAFGLTLGAVCTLIVVMGFAACDEWRQHQVPLREGKWQDVALDSGGAIGAIGLVGWKARKRKPQAS